MADLDFAEQSDFLQRNLGPYHIESEIGAGAMGTVYRAIHTGLDRPVALKVLRADMLQDADSIRRFLREARSSARLEHPNIVSVYDAGELDGTYYIAMKLLEGKTLQNLLAATGPLSPDRVVRLGIQLASALDYAHGRDVVHLDVKPANVIVTAQDQATLTDFSIAQALNPGATRSATIAGTPLYMSPEQIQGKDLDSRSDIYSLGLLLFEMCMGHPPFQGQFVTVMYAHLHSPVPDIRSTMPHVPEPLAAVIYRALAKDRSERYQTAGELLRALERSAPMTDVDVSGTVRLTREEMAAIMGDDGPVVPTAPAPAEASAVPPGDGAPRPRWKSPFILVPSFVFALAVAVGIVVQLAHAASASPRSVLKPQAAVLAVAHALVTVGYQQDPRTGAIHPGTPLVSLPAARLKGQTIYAVFEVHLRHASGTSSQSVRLRYSLIGPDGSRFATSPNAPIQLAAQHPSSTVVYGFQLPRSTVPPPGRYTVRLLANGRPLKVLHFKLS